MREKYFLSVAALLGDLLFDMGCVMCFCTQMSASDFIFRNPGMDAQEILFLDICCGFVPLTRDLQDDIVFSYLFSSRGAQLEYVAQVAVSDIFW